MLVGCEKLTVVDLDAIDVSNLNRQFLFRKKHVGKSKAEGAGEAIKRLISQRRGRLTIHGNNITYGLFEVDWFRASMRSLTRITSCQKTCQ